MLPAAPGDIVSVHYTGKLENGEIFHITPEDRPLQFVIGKKEVIAGVDQGVIGMVSGEKRTLTVPADQAYGKKIKEKIEEIERSQLPEGLDLKIGGKLEITGHDGQQLYVEVVALTETTATLDANHPLAGKNLIFKIQMLSVEKNPHVFHDVISTAFDNQNGQGNLPH
jgi:peptidylprolyl isomerase